MSSHHNTQSVITTHGIEREGFCKSNALPFAAWLTAITALLLTLFSLYLTITLQWQGPFRDLWEFVGEIERQFSGVWNWHYLLDAYGGAHRIFLPKLLFFSDFYWLGGRNLLTISTALLCQCVYLGLIVAALRKSGLPATEQYLLAATFTAALFSTTQVSNFLYAMDVQWHMANVLGLCALYCFTHSSGCARLPFTILAGSLAALCNFTGLIPLPVAGLALLVAGRGLPGRTPALAAIAIISLLYVHTGKNEQHVVIAALRASDNLGWAASIISNTLSGMGVYVLRYLSSPLSREWPLAGHLLSLAGLAVTAWHWLPYRRQTLTPWQQLCLLIASCITVSAVFTAFGRVIYPNSAINERYQTLVMPFYPALLGLLWPTARLMRRSAVFLCGWLLVFGSYLLPAQLDSARDMATLSNRVNLAHTAARAGVLEFPYPLATLSHPLVKNRINAVKDNDAFLRREQLGYFQHLPRYALGSRLDAASLPVCTGFAQQENDPATGTLLIHGQLLLDGQPLTDMLLLQAAHVVGLGSLIRPEGYLGLLTRQDPADSRFRVYARQAVIKAAEPLQLVGVRDGSPACLMTATP